MLVFGSFEGQRLTLEIPTGQTVQQLKETIQNRLGISVDLYRQDKKVLVISYAGSDLGDDWVFSDLGIVPGTTIKIQLREEVKPVLYIRCSHSQETISLYDDITIAHSYLDKIRNMASMKSGLPVGIFRLTTEDGREMFDQHRLEDYGVDVGHTILLENWDGWNEFLNLAIMGFTPQLREEVKPVLYIRCSHSQETISLYDDITIAHSYLDKIRNMASMKSGLPVGIFRLTTEDGREMFDQHRLEDYGVDVGHTILLENWDGWNEFLNLAIMGFTPQVVSQIGGEEIVARYQMKVALFIAAHFGHVDLARAMLRQGVKSDDPTGYHPARMWCKEDGHIDALKCPVHEATFCGQLGVLRLFVNADVTCLKAKDGYDLEPLNIALRNKVKNCASFLLTKQWSKININKTFALHLATYTRLKKWCERAKERALLKYGQSKSTLRRRNFKTGPLVSHGILVDGFSQSPMTGKPKALLQREEKENKERERARPKFQVVLLATREKIMRGGAKSLTARSATSASSSTEDAGAETDGDKKATARRAAGPKKRRARVSSALLLSKAKSSEGSIPLPLISHEQDRRPFFYHQGLREDALVDSALELVSKYRGGDSSRERAIQSLTTANTFRDKPWLGQVRVALSLTSNSLKRNVRRLQGRKK
ncbi:hypothetical protein EGW08_020868, partial [Elysia chlorotica]